MIDLLMQSLRRLRASFAKDRLDRELDAEMAHHLELAIEESLGRGLPPEEARRQALLRFGGTEQAKERQREARGLPALEALLQDARHALRSLRRDRAFAAAAVPILALAIGANIAVFSVVNAILLRPLPFRNPQELAWLSGNHGAGGLSDRTYRVDAYEAFRRASQSFSETTAFVPFNLPSETKLMGGGEPKPVSFVWVAGNFFQTLGIPPARGRLFTPEEGVRGGRRAVLLSHPFWQRQFGGDPAIVGRTIQLDDEAVTVVGVLPASFDFGAVFAPGSRADLFRPVFLEDIRSWGHMLSVVGRLRPGVTVAEAQAEANGLFPRLKGDGNAAWSTDVRTTITGLRDHVSGRLRRSLGVLWCAVGLILLIACVNLSSLLMARLAARGRELAVRRALGAGRGRLARQMLTESLVLWGAAAALGLALAVATTSYLAHQGSISLPLMSSVRVDVAALVWTLVVALLGSVLFGLASGLRTAKRTLREALGDGGPRMSQGRMHGRLRGALVVSEVALACVLLVGAGLLLRSFLRVLDVDLGFQPSGAAAIKIDYDDGGSGARRGVILREVLERVRALPGVEGAAVSDILPLERNRSWGLMAKGRVFSEKKDYSAFVHVVTPGYFDAMGMRLREGRDFTWHDTPESEPVVIINQAAARREWPGEDPVGRLAEEPKISAGDTRVVGVVADARESGVEEAPSPAIYVPSMQADPQGAELVVRAGVPPEALAPGLMSTLRALNPGQPATELRPLQRIVDSAVSPRRFFVVLVSAFAALGLVLASLGIYGVISYSVSRQRQEIGIRMALGASRARVQLDVIARTLRLALVGIALGATASFVVARAIAGLLFETEPADPSILAATILAVAAVALVAGYIPAHRASRIDPTITLRSY
jgi:putative ABC transport system permease protein